MITKEMKVELWLLALCVVISVSTRFTESAVLLDYGFRVMQAYHALRNQ